MVGTPSNGVLPFLASTAMENGIDGPSVSTQSLGIHEDGASEPALFEQPGPGLTQPTLPAELHSKKRTHLQSTSPAVSSPTKKANVAPRAAVGDGASSSASPVVQEPVFH